MIKYDLKENFPLVLCHLGREEVTLKYINHLKKYINPRQCHQNLSTDSIDYNWAC